MSIQHPWLSSGKLQSSLTTIEVLTVFIGYMSTESFLTVNRVDIYGAVIGKHVALVDLFLMRVEPWKEDKGPPYKFGMGPPEGLIRP